MNTQTLFDQTPATYPEGSYYELPEGWTWADVAWRRARWNTPKTMVPLASVFGVCAWGVPTASEYKCNAI